jgi:putative chitinase
MPRLTRDNFSISEMSDCSLAERMGIDNTPSIAVLENLSVTVTGLEHIRALLGYPIHVNSGYRCEALEKVLCQADYSTWCSRSGHAINRDSWTLYFCSKKHPTGHAADFTCAQFGSPVDIVRSIQSSTIKFDICILEGSWVHVSFAPKMRREVRVKEFDQFGVTVTTPFQPESLDESHYAPKTFSNDFQETTRLVWSPLSKH